MASGMPWPRIFSEPKRAISPMTRPPIAGASDHPQAGLQMGERYGLRAERLQPDQVGDEGNRPQQHPRRRRAAGADNDRHRDEHENTAIGGEVTKARQQVPRLGMGGRGGLHNGS